MRGIRPNGVSVPSGVSSCTRSPTDTCELVGEVLAEDDAAGARRRAVSSASRLPAQHRLAAISRDGRLQRRDDALDVDERLAAAVAREQRLAQDDRRGADHRGTCQQLPHLGLGIGDARPSLKT